MKKKQPRITLRMSDDAWRIGRWVGSDTFMALESLGQVQFPKKLATIEGDFLWRYGQFDTPTSFDPEERLKMIETPFEAKVLNTLIDLGETLDGQRIYAREFVDHYGVKRALIDTLYRAFERFNVYSTKDTVLFYDNEYLLAALVRGLVV